MARYIAYSGTRIIKMIIKFDPYFFKYTSFQETIEVKGDSLRVVLESLLNDYPQLHVFLVADNGKEADKTSFKLNGEYITEVKEIHRKVGSEDILEVGCDVPYGESAVGRIIAGAALMAIGLFNWGATWGPGLALMGAGMALGGVGELIAGTPSLPTFDSGNNTSATYTFSGIKNTTVLGTPIGIVYGTHRVGGHILNAYNDVIGTGAVGNTSWLRLQLGLCEGEINSIDPNSLEINGRRAYTFPSSDIEALYRYGSKLQPAPSSALVTAVDATSVVTPETQAIITATGWERTLETTATSVELQLSRVSLPKILFISYGFRVYYKLASDASDYTKFYDFTAKYEKNNPPKKFTVNFVNPGVYKIKVVETAMLSYEYNSWVDGVYSPEIQYIPEAFYVSKYTIQEAGTISSDTGPVMKNFNQVSNSTDYNLLVANDTEGSISPAGVVSINGLVMTTSIPVDKVIVNFTAPVLYKSSGGDIKETSVDLKIYWKKTDEEFFTTHYENGTTEKFKAATMKGKTKSSLEYSVALPMSEVATYDLLVVRETKSNIDDLLIQDAIYVKDLVEVVNESLVYPHTALMGLSIKATEYISGGLPNVTSIIQGTKVKVPVNYNGTRRYMAGSFTGEFQPDKQWTDNPVWCLYDLITNSRYGLKDYFKILPSKAGIMLANFYIMAQYCDARVTREGNVITDINDPAYESARPRFSLNIVIDQSKTAIEWLTIICASMRATLYYTEGVVFIDIDRPKPISQLFNMSNIKEYVETGMSFKQLPNVYEVQFNNKEKDYDQDTLILEDPDYQLDITKEESKKTLQLIGVTEENQAKSLAKYALRVGQLLTTSVSFKTSTYGLLSTVGDVIGVQHDVPQWGFGGRVVSYDVETRLITVSDDVEISSDVSVLYSMQLVCKGKSPEIFAVTPSNTGICREFTLDELPVNTPAKDDLYIVGDITNTIKPFKIISLKRDKDEVIEVTCVEYLDEIYTDADDITDLPIIVMPNYSSLDTIKRSVKNVLVESTVYVDSTGNLKTGARVYYSKPVQLGWAGVIVYYGINGVYSETPIDKTGVVNIPEITVEGEYQFICISVYTDGTRQSIAEALRDTEFTPYYTLYITPYIDNAEFIKGIKGLQLVGQGNTTEFAGKDAKFTWRKPAVVDFNLNDLATDSALATATADSWLKEYQITIKNADGSVRHSTKVYDEHYDYKYEQNYVDGAGRPVRTFSITVIAVDRLGRESAPKTLQVANPVPARIT